MYCEIPECTGHAEDVHDGKAVCHRCKEELKALHRDRPNTRELFVLLGILAAAAVVAYRIWRWL